MNVSGRQKKYALISAALYAAAFLTYIQISLRNGETMDIAAYILLWIGSAALAVTVFMKNPKGVLCAAGIRSLAALLLFLRNAVHGFFDPAELSVFAAYAALIALLVLSEKGNGLAGKLWFVPGVLLGLRFLISGIDLSTDLAYIFSAADIWMFVLSFLITEMAALFLAGLWIREPFAFQRKYAIMEIRDWL